MVCAGAEELAKYAGKRKHGSHMNNEEIDGLFKRLKSVAPKDWTLSRHSLTRLQDKKIRATKNDIVSTIFWANLIEYKIDYNPVFDDYDERVVLRAKAKVNKHYNLNVVYSLTRKQVVTVWMNHVNDLHNTLDWNIYDKEMKVFGI